MMYYIRNVEDGQVVPLVGACDGADGEFCIGLTMDERMACAARINGVAVRKPDDESNDADIVVPLVNFRVWKTSGVTVCPASRDLPCRMNGSDIGLEANIIPGNKIDVADKVLELVEGTAIRHPKRHLPPTPGVPILPKPPPKPKRSTGKASFQPHNDSDCLQKDSSLIDELKEWCADQLPNSEHELLQNVKEPDQLASLASSYLTKHINLHTDIVMTSELADNIFTVLQEVAWHRRDILKKFLGEVITEVAGENEDVDSEQKHRPVTSLLVEILRQFLDPRSLVLLCLQLLRALSHIPGNVMTMVNSQTTASVLGSMAVYKDDENVQNMCLDILAKMATFIPGIGIKPPMRESSIDLIVMAISLHSQNLMVVQATVRTLANLASTLHILASSVMIDVPNPSLLFYMTTVMAILDHLYANTLDKVRQALAAFSSDLNVKMDGRRYLFEYAKVDQLRSQRNIWEIQPNSPKWHQKCSLDSVDNDVDNNIDNDVENDQKTDEEVQNINHLVVEESQESGLSDDELNEDTEEGSSSGILKKARSFENLRTPERKVFFSRDSKEPSPSLSVSSSPTSSQGSPRHENNENGTDGTDIEILSRSRICPTTLLPIESSNGDLCYFPPQPTSDSGTDIVSPTTPHPPPRRPIQAPLVHINSQSDSDGDVFVDSPTMRHSHRQLDEEVSSSHLSSSSPMSFPLNSKFAPVDLNGFRYSAADKNFLMKAVTVQITCHVCSASVNGSNPQTLKLIDMPYKELLYRPGIPKAIGQFANSQLDIEASLMDIDPAAAISIIDAVRYKMLAFDLVRQYLLVLLKNLSSALHGKMFSIAEEVLHSVAIDASISSVLQDESFISTLNKELDTVLESFDNPAHIQSIKECINRLAKVKVTHQVKNTL